jgi:Cys-rich protein (TIGR01571 family)
LDGYNDDRQSPLAVKDNKLIDGTGQWKDGLFDCFRFGLFHSTVWTALCCPQVLMKQLSNRLSEQGESSQSGSSLSPCGSISGSGAAQPAGTSSSHYKRGTTLFLAACVLDFLFIAPILELTASGVSSERQSTSPSASNSGTSVGVQFFYVMWTLALTFLALFSLVQLRAAVRAKYGIPAGRCGACEDLCCVFCCHGCTLAQMARQTADYDEEAGNCCTVDGRSGSERLNPCLFL